MPTPPTHTLTATPSPNTTTISVPAAPDIQRPSSKVHRAAVNGVMVLGAALVAWSGAIHLHLWMGGYKSIHIIGPLFVAQAITAFAVAIGIAVLRWATAALAGAAFLASTIGGLLVSSWHGIFGFHDSLSAPFASISLLVETIGIVVLAFAAFVAFRLRRRSLTHAN